MRLAVVSEVAFGCGCFNMVGVLRAAGPTVRRKAMHTRTQSPDADIVSSHVPWHTQAHLAAQDPSELAGPCTISQTDSTTRLCLERWPWPQEGRARRNCLKRRWLEPRMRATWGDNPIRGAGVHLRGGICEGTRNMGVRADCGGDAKITRDTCCASRATAGLAGNAY